MSTGSKFLSRELNDKENISEIAQEARKNSLSMSNIESCGEDKVDLVDNKLDETQKKDESGEEIIYDDGVTQLEDSIGRLRQLLEERKEIEGQGFTRSMSDPAKTVTRLEYDDKVLRTFSVKKSDPVSCSASEPDSDCEDDSLKSTEERFGNFIRFVSQTNKCSGKQSAASQSLLLIRRKETKYLLPLHNGRKSIFFNKFNTGKREMRLLKFKFSTTLAVSIVVSEEVFGTIEYLYKD